MNDTVCRNAGEETGNASRHQQEREVGNDLYRLHRRNCRKNLSYVVEHGTGGTVSIFLEEPKTKTALVTVGEFLGDTYALSKLYDKTFTHEFRKGTEA